ncbi:MAG TPA: hypothetical protein VEB40_10305 [Flavipsychrobacter sp.]|nr:hypothetical protein [Flavipsychrobacter sp.]
MGNVDPKGFYIEKDATSDSYAVICYNSFAHETGERLQVHQYSGDHQELSNSFYGKVGDYKYLNYIAMLVKEDAVYLATYGYNTERSGGKDSKIIVSRLRKGEKDFSHQHIEMSDDFSKTTGVMRYNPGNQKIQLLTSTLIEDKKAKPNKDGVITRYQLALMNYVDPQTLDVKSQVLKFEKLSDYIKANLNDKNVVGPPQDMFIDPDNTTSIISEELYQNSEYDTHSTSNSTAFGNVGLTQYSPDGEETYAFGFPKRHGCFGFLDIFSHSRKVKGYWQYLNNGVGFSHTGYQDENFFSFDYINTGKARYIIYNDLPSNFDKKANEEPETLSTFHIGHAVGRTIGKNSGSITCLVRLRIEIVQWLPFSHHTTFGLLTLTLR